MHISSVAYHLDILYGINVHLVFHVSCLKERIGFIENVVTIKPWYLIAKKNLDAQTKHLRFKQIQAFKIKWLNQIVYDATYERARSKIYLSCV